MDRRKEPLEKSFNARDAIRALLQQDEAMADNKILFGIYRKGWAANMDGLGRAANPYAHESPYWTQWARGWTECSKIMRRRRSDAWQGET